MNVDTLLQPISADAPCGEDLSFSAEFDAIAHDRRADDPTLDQGEWKTDIKVADWAKVEASCTALLSTRTKDLRLMGWLAEARTHLHGFGGLADGLSLLAQGCQAFWDSIHPLPEQGDQEQRIGNLTWLLTQVVSLSHVRPLVDAGPGRRYVLREIEVARTRHAEADGDSRNQPVEALTSEALLKAQNDTPADFFIENLAQARRAQEALAGLQAVVDALLGADGPGFVAARKALEDVIHAAERLVRDSGADASVMSDRTVDEAAMANAGASSAATPTAEGAGAPGHGVSRHIQNRAQALQQLRLVAEFFRRTEPHSPVAYLADKAVHWGNMPLHVWLRTVLKDGSSLAHVEELLGLDGVKPDQG